MRGGTCLPAALAALIVTAAAHAQGTTTQGTNGCLFVGPTFGANVLDIGWTTSGSSGGGLLPGLRAGYWMPGGFVAAEAGVTAGLSPAFGYGQLSLKLGGVYAHDFGSSGPLHTYGLGGLEVNLQTGVSGGSGFAAPSYGFTLAGGLQYSLNDRWTLGGELGLHTLIDPGPTSLGLSTGLFVSVVGSWSLPGPCSSHPGTVSPPTGPEIPPTTDNGPSTTPPDVVTHSDSYATPCSVLVNDGWMEPTQDVWQDDVSFEDKPGKQLTRLDGDAVAYRAELPMVVKKATLLFGVHHYLRGGAPTIVDSRDVIVLSGLTNCTTPKPVLFRFRLANGGSPETIYTSPEVGQIKLTGPAQKDYEPWTVRLPVRTGIKPAEVFFINAPGAYVVTAELLSEGNPTGLQMTVAGEAKVMSGPAVHFVPVRLTKQDGPTEQALLDATALIEQHSREKIPDWFPLAPGGLPTSVRVLRDLTDAEVPGRWFEARRISYLVAALNDTLAASTFLDGGGRVVAVMTGPDFRSVFGEGAAGMTVDESVKVKPRSSTAKTLSWKVMLIPKYEDWDTVAHEILHTLPEGWAEDEMKAECGLAYHNLKDPIAHGESITLDSQPSSHERKAGMISFMGPEVSLDQVWMDQCSYWHLTKMLAGAPPDPPVLLVRALIGLKKGKPLGELRPVYELMGTSDLAFAKVGGAYAFVFKGAKGEILGRYPFNPRATDLETKAKLEITSFVGRVPVVPGWTALELQGPGGAVLDKKARSDTPPQVSIDAPKDGQLLSPAGGKVHVRWTAKPATPQTSLLSSVLYSSDRGAHWTDQAFEQAVTELDVALDPKQTDHLVKVVTTDGTRSAEALIRLHTAAAPPPKGK